MPVPHCVPRVGGGAATHPEDVTDFISSVGMAPAAMGRRHLPLLLLPFLPHRASAMPPEIRFRIMREGTAIGTHRVRFSDTGGEVAARTEVEVAVRLMGITVYRLSHHVTEIWSGGRLRLVTSRHERNGKVVEMMARAVEGAVLARGAEGDHRLPPEAAPLTWWDASRFSRPVFDAETGRLLRLRWTRTPMPGGGMRWQASGDEEGEGSYAPDGAWLDWRTRGEDGSLVTYERV